MDLIQLQELKNVAPLSKLVGVVLLSGFILPFISHIFVDYFALIVGKTFPFGWNVVTSAVVDTSVISVAFNVPAAVFLIHILEPVAGQQGTVKIMLATVAGSGALTFLTISFLYYLIAVFGMGSAIVDKMAAKLLYTPICGFHGAIAGLLVALKQALPENEVMLLRSVKSKIKHLPSLFILASFFIAIITRMVLKLVPFIVFGTYSSWFYLRYFHIMPDSGLRGDPSDQFRFASFFPEKAQPIVDIIAEKLYTICKVGNWVPAQANGSRGGAQDEGSFVGGDGSSNSLDAVRRRERGMKALEERLGNKVTTTTSQPDEDLETGS